MRPGFTAFVYKHKWPSSDWVHAGWHVGCHFVSLQLFYFDFQNVSWPTNLLQVSIFKNLLAGLLKDGYTGWQIDLQGNLKVRIVQDFRSKFHSETRSTLSRSPAPLFLLICGFACYLVFCCLGPIGIKLFPALRIVFFSLYFFVWVVCCIFNYKYLRAVTLARVTIWSLAPAFLKNRPPCARCSTYRRTVLLHLPKFR